MKTKLIIILSFAIAISGAVLTDEAENRVTGLIGFSIIGLGLIGLFIAVVRGRKG